MADEYKIQLLASLDHLKPWKKELENIILTNLNNTSFIPDLSHSYNESLCWLIVTVKSEIMFCSILVKRDLYTRQTQCTFRTPILQFDKEYVMVYPIVNTKYYRKTELCAFIRYVTGIITKAGKITVVCRNENIPNSTSTSYSLCDNTCIFGSPIRRYLTPQISTYNWKFKTNNGRHSVFLCDSGIVEFNVFRCIEIYNSNRLQSALVHNISIKGEYDNSIVVKCIQMSCSGSYDIINLCLTSLHDDTMTFISPGEWSTISTVQ